MLVETLLSDIDEAIDSTRRMMESCMPGGGRSRSEERILSLLTRIRVKLDQLPESTEVNKHEKQ